MVTDSSTLVAKPAATLLQETCYELGVKGEATGQPHSPCGYHNPRLVQAQLNPTPDSCRLLQGAGEHDKNNK